MSNIKISKKTIIGSIIFVVLLSLFIFNSAIASLSPVKSISIKSDNLSYDNKEEGSWELVKQAYWNSKWDATIELSMDTIKSSDTNDNYKKIIYVVDTSGSMQTMYNYTSRIDLLKSALINVSTQVLSEDNSEIALITFNNNAALINDFSSDLSLITQNINNISVSGDTNYYNAYKEVYDLLKNYEDDEDVLMLFITDGHSESKHSLDKSMYEILKKEYDFLEIHAIQYEMSYNYVVSEISDVSDYGFVATGNTIESVIDDSIVNYIKYDSIEISDIVNLDNFKINGISVTHGKYTEDDGLINWTIEDMNVGINPKMEIKVSLINENDSGLYETNTNTSIKTSLTTRNNIDINENKETSDTPILSTSYKVTYDLNSPDDCVASASIDDETYNVFDSVTISNTKPTCSGYIFKGWQVVNEDVTIYNDEYFYMPEDDVEIRAKWGKTTIKKSMVGEVAKSSECDKTLTFDYSVTNSWPATEGTGATAYEVNFTINTADTPVEDWTITLKGPEDMYFTNGAGNFEYEISDGVATITPTGSYEWQKTIGANASKTITMYVATSEELVMDYIYFNGCLAYSGTHSEKELEGISISPHTKVIEIGEELQMDYSTTPTGMDVSLTWTSSNESVASISSDGKVVGLAEGTTTITATAEGFSATATITVVNESHDSSVTFTFSSPYYSGTYEQFSIKITNNTSKAIKQLSFEAEVPEGTTWTFWTNNMGFTVDSTGTVLTSGTESWRPSIGAGETIEITGAITLPAGNDAQDYLEINFGNVTITN